MEKQTSFTKYERKILPRLRENLNRAESTEDVKKFFSYSLVELLEQSFSDNDLKIDYDDVIFEPETAPFFQISERLRSSAFFASAWENSDIRHIIANLAKTARNRYTRLEKHFDKTEAKIRR